jgi:hypothetical protein
MQTDKEAFMEIARGGLAALLVLGVFFAFVFTLGKQQGDTDWAKFKIVDSYNNCNVVRYMPEGGAKYFYFLDCAGR